MDEDRLARFNQARLADRQIDELSGMIRMALADGALEMFEVEFIVRWMEIHKPVRTIWPGDIIFDKLAQSLADGTPYADHEADLLDLLNRFVGTADVERSDCAATRIPLTDPLPVVTTPGRTFCLTGKFVSGPREQCEQIIVSLGGETSRTVNRRVNYLVIGEFGSTDWLHSTHGRKIQRAVKLNDSSQTTIAIVSEEHWLQCLAKELGSA